MVAVGIRGLEHAAVARAKFFQVGGVEMEPAGRRPRVGDLEGDVVFLREFDLDLAHAQRGATGRDNHEDGGFAGEPSSLSKTQRCESLPPRQSHAASTARA